MTRFPLMVCVTVLFFAIARGQTPVTPPPSTDVITTGNGPLTIRAITHASLVLQWNNKTIYVDPTGGAEKYKGIAAPDIILITDIHGDHFDPATLSAVNTGSKFTQVPVQTGNGETNRSVDTRPAMVILPAAVSKALEGNAANNISKIIINNGDSISRLGIAITAIPMYNLPETANSRHPKGRGNGYILTFGDKKIYISGDTQGIPEMLALKNITAAFVCMNLPYTMDIQEAAKSVLTFNPQIVYPYHYRGQDVNAFKQLVQSENRNIDVRLLNWYPAN